MTPPPAGTHATLTTLGRLLRRQMPAYAAGAVLLAVLQTLMNIRDRLFKQGVDSALGAHDGRTLQVVLLILVVVACAAGVRVLSRVTMFHAGRMAEYQLRSALLERLHRLGFSFFEKMPTGEIMSRATNDLGQVRLLLGFGALNVVNTAFALISAVSLMVEISVPLTAAALAPFPLLMLVTRLYGRAMFKRTRANQEALGQLSERVQGSLAGVRVVRAFALEQAERAAFRDASAGYLDKALALARLRGFMAPTMATVAALGMLIVFWYGGHLVVARQLTQGEFVAFWAALARLTWPIMAFGFVIAIVQRGRAGYARIQVILEAEPNVTDGTRAPPEPMRGGLRVRGLSFRHGDRTVLQDVSLDVAAGGALAIVGRVGAGKSTLAALLARLLPTPHGTVFLDEHDVCDLPLAAVRRAIGYAQQDAFLFSTTVARNIAFALDDPDSAQAASKVREAAGEAQILEEIERLPDGLDSIVGERGLQLSGGQKQRVALARALLYEPAILVLDDPLSAVDARTEQAILQAIERQAGRRTVVLITSRVSAAARCDRVLVLDAGRVVEQGTHQELVRSGGIYAQFAEDQRLQG
ncbi:MAG: ABC transporter ATP-binding protein/permease, partial [Polyangiaceae bacterium]|nr:ABC transporter ATP-binding protein/permease [Polyangiaceae bacterium]